jgi:hypothetical protein
MPGAMVVNGSSESVPLLTNLKGPVGWSLSNTPSSCGELPGTDEYHG